MSVRTTLYIEAAKQSAKRMAQDLICAIDVTPTSEKRNKLTEANIHLMSAQKALDEAGKLQ